jgi:hypothetical protein
MSGALDAFRAQREAVDDLRARVEEVAKLIAGVTVQVDAIAKNSTLRDVLTADWPWTTTYLPPYAVILAAIVAVRIHKYTSTRASGGRSAEVVGA